MVAKPSANCKSLVRTLVQLIAEAAATQPDIVEYILINTSPYLLKSTSICISFKSNFIYLRKLQLESPGEVVSTTIITVV